MRLYTAQDRAAPTESRSPMGFSLSTTAPLSTTMTMPTSATKMPSTVFRVGFSLPGVSASRMAVSTGAVETRMLTLEDWV